MSTRLRARAATTAATLLLTASAAHAVTTTLYDATATSPVQTLDGANWLWHYGAVGSAAEATSASATTLDTSASIVTQAGFNASNGGSFPVAPMPTLNRFSGYTVEAKLAVTAENHSSNTNRAGFSLIALSQDHLGIEIAFWTDHIWAYDFTAPSTFTHSAEDVAFTTTATTDYFLSILNNTYTLKSGSTTLLTGNLRDYSPRGLVYPTPSYLFLGDDTSESSSASAISFIAVTTPEPTTLSLLLLTSAAMLRRRRGGGVKG